MSFRADYYEALFLQSLDALFAGKVKYEPDRSQHTCDNICVHKNSCDKYVKYKKLVYTVPDFCAQTPDLTYYHVCYWDSRETSHAKFWRTIAELLDVKRFIPDAKSVCVVFEASFNGSTYVARGWYEDFLVAFRELFDGVIYFDNASLQKEALKAETKLRNVGGTQNIFDNYLSRITTTKCGSLLRKSITNPLMSESLNKKNKLSLWRQEIKACSRIQHKVFNIEVGSRIRNAILQLALISLLDPKKRGSDSLINDLADWRILVPKDDLDLAVLINKIPIELRNGNYTYLVASCEEGVTGELTCCFCEDISWLLIAWKGNSLPIEKSAFAESLNDIVLELNTSIQVLESVGDISSICTASLTYSLTKKTLKTLWKDFLAVDPKNEYNIVAELVIESSGSGTYPLVREVNRRNRRLSISRNDIRSLYTNKCRGEDSDRQSKILFEIYKLADHINPSEIEKRILLRKAKRIVGAQSDLNPLEVVVRNQLKKVNWVDGVSVLKKARTIGTLATHLVHSNEIGEWRISLCIRNKAEIIPVFLSAMKSPADCRHKTREFCAHLSLARYKYSSGVIRKTKISRGLAVLEGGYSEEDRQAFHLAGFTVCALTTLLQSLQDMGLAKVTPIAILQLNHKTHING